MRRNTHIENLWNVGGPFTGADGRPHTRVTVELTTRVHFEAATNIGVMSSRGSPIRWFQREDNSQSELEVPNILSVDIDRSIDNDAATCRIEMSNQWMYDNLAIPVNAPELGTPGYFTPDHGESADAAVRWGHETNDWAHILEPNAILRTYQGYGGHDKTLQDCLEDGNLMITGVWYIDVVAVGTSGKMTITCRDAAKLLLDQQLFPPLVVKDRYPLKYFRYAYENRQISATSGVYTDENPAPTEGIPDTTPGDKNTVYVDSDVDRWFGSGAGVDGHFAYQATDGNPNTYYLSVGHANPDLTSSTGFVEFTCGEWVNAVRVTPLTAGYVMYISVMENGSWQGAQTVPYSHHPIVGTRDGVVNIEAAVTYIASYDVTEGEREYNLPRMYLADRVRLSFRRMQSVGGGQFPYHAGIVDARLIVTAGVSWLAAYQVPEYTIAPIFYAADGIRNLSNLNSTGYITVSNFGQVDVFGDCREYPATRSDDELVAYALRAHIPTIQTSSVALTPTGDGYWILYERGQIRSFGSAQHYGEPAGDFNYESGLTNGGINKAAAIISTPTGLGYWVVTFGGQIFNYGDAEPYADEPGWPGEFFHGAAGHPGAQGLYLVATNGAVYTRGAAVWYGNYNKTNNVTNTIQVEGGSEIAIDIAATHTGLGYWILTSSGRVQQFGDAEHFGEAKDPVENKSSYDRFYHLMPAPSSTGYLVNDGDGKIVPYGDVRHFGSPVFGTVGQLRKDGNYLDYSDIVKDLLLWSGFYLYSTAAVPPTAFPPINGSIESTGAFSETDLPDDLFDKKPVMDAITEMKETVGYIFFVDEEGGACFESPNWWQRGNFLTNGTHVDYLPEIDERHNLISYETDFNDTDARSVIIIASEDPYGNFDNTVTSTFLVPSTASTLRGLLKPAMWVNGFFMNKADQEIMAELVAMHIWFAQRMGSVSCAANPCIGIDDQVRIYERITGETYVHYVRGISTSHNLDSGEYTMRLTTNWLGAGEEWPIAPSVTGGGPEAVAGSLFQLSVAMQRFLSNSPSEKIKTTYQVPEGS
jgi:hypothetical protein